MASPDARNDRITEYLPVDIIHKVGAIAIGILMLIGKV